MQARHVPSTSNVYIPDDSWEAAPTEQALATETTKDYLPRLKKMIFSPTILSHADHTTMRSIGENRLVPPGKDVLTEDSNDKSTLALLHNATPNRCKLSDTDPDPSSHTKILIRSPTKRPRLSRAISENELDRLVAISCESKAKLSTSELTPTLGKGVQRNEIPNTPTQGSSQLSTAVTSTHALSLSDAEAVTLSEANDTLVSLDQPGSRKSSALVTQLCTVCRKQRVLMKLGTKDAKWQLELQET
ncbi:hypothetical protein BDV95DRAFT_606024 [Massariosphaeria phaeospora]|uniref:Uncharacterized protein n=1 Tax=Massariosphaeria phaeospora TaxID=100035 RepID=A0A7C8I788_9PLEO|nr:hypothetical protein BDV95DRAFT_606024 [Massariosphaeria phaeospora]